MAGSISIPEDFNQMECKHITQLFEGGLWDSY
jgi:hypothetical protein